MRELRGGRTPISYDARRYGKVVGDYDRMYPGAVADTDAAVRFLAELAGTYTEHSLMEFGIGTGRIALPLSRLGVHVAGVDASDRMVSQLRTKPDSDGLEIIIGDYRDARLTGARFAIVLLAFNGIFDPRGRAAQLDIFRNAARHLTPGGCFVVESWVMSEAQRSGDWSVVPRYVGDEHVELQLARYDIETNGIERTLVHLRPDGMRFVTVTDTYASPGELDVMADVTGFDRRARFAGWTGTGFTSVSTSHVSVYSLRTR